MKWGRNMKLPKQLSTIVIAAAVAGVVSFGAGAAVEASATASSVTYQACLSPKGALSKVSGTVMPTCPVGSTSISWNSQGATGPAGPAGPAGPPGTTVNSCLSPPGPNLNFSTCTLSNFAWPYVDLSGDNLISTNLSSADLYNSKLIGANLTGANLTGTILTLANLTNANLTGANLTGAYLSYADVTGVVWNLTTCPDGTESSLSYPQTCIGHGFF